MSFISHAIDGYRLIHIGYNTNRNVTAVINCYRNHVRYGFIRFYKEGTPIPEGLVAYPDHETIHLNFSDHNLQSIIDTLRYEKPLHISFNDATRTGWLSTSNEPIGEEELG